MKIIDAHQHFWHYDQKELPWITEKLAILKRDYLPEELEAIYKEQGVAGCVAVQAAQSERETHFLLSLADQHPFIKGVVGWIDLESPQLADALKAYLPFPKLKGFRHILQDEKDPEYVLRPAFQKGLETIFSLGFTYDILVFPHQLPGAIETVKRFPGARMVIDHLAKPEIAKGNLASWKAQMMHLKDFDNVYCKLSGMVTEHHWKSWAKEDFYPYLDVMMDVFGVDRLMYGSDWPVCLLSGTYGEVKGILESYLDRFSTEQREKVWFGNAKSFYQL